jgi:biotin carboxylase
MPKETLDEIELTYRQLVDALGIVAGSIHGELIVTENGIYLVEMANRGGGSGTSSHCIPAYSGVDLLEANVRYAVGDERPVRRTLDRAGVLRFMLFGVGKVESIEGVQEAQSLPGVVACDVYVKVGDRLDPPVMDTQRHGYIITVADTLSEAQATADEVERTIKVSLS